MTRTFVKYTIRRFLLLIPVLIGVTTLVFLLVRLLPGDPAEALLANSPFVTKETVQELRALLNLDKPIYQQYILWIINILRGDLGRSVWTGRSVMAELIPRYINTIELSVLSITIATIVGILFGVTAAVKRGTMLDVATSVAAVSGVSMPSFWFALMLMLVFSVGLHWLPAGGAGTPLHVILPAVTLGLGSSAAIIMRMTRSCVIEALSQDYIRTARAKGCSNRSVLYRHALRNALIPVTTVIGLQFGYLLTGQVIVETVFGWPGIGKMMVDAISSRDYPIIQGTVIFIAFTFVLVNFIVDILYAYLDPRLKLG